MRRILIYILMFVCSIWGKYAYAQPIFDYKANAVYVYNFIKYTEWSGHKSTIQVGIVGATQLDEELRSLINRKKNNALNIIVRKISADEARKCDVVIVAAGANNELKAVDKNTEKLPILIITEKSNMGKLGACISFTINEDEDFKTEYQVSLKNCKNRGLKLNAEIKNNAELMR